MSSSDKLGKSSLYTSLITSHTTSKEQKHLYLLRFVAEPSFCLSIETERNGIEKTNGRPRDPFQHFITDMGYYLLNSFFFGADTLQENSMTDATFFNNCSFIISLVNNLTHQEK
ncbi:hypothetical protein ACJX0J_035864 [Zea mays]